MKFRPLPARSAEPLPPYNSLTRFNKKHMPKKQTKANSGTQSPPIIAVNRKSKQSAHAILKKIPLVSSYQILAVPDTASAIAEVHRKKAMYALVPLEDNQEGTLYSVWDALVKCKLSICAECYQGTNREYVRFGLVSRAPAKPHGSKVSLVVSLPHVSGSLSRFLVQCAGRGLNLTKVESRPIPKKKGHYLFYVDFEHSFQPEVLERVLAALKREASSYTLIGAYEKSKKGPFDHAS